MVKLVAPEYDCEIVETLTGFKFIGQQILGFENTRALQLDIARAREDGQVILSATTGGYYLPKDNAEIEEFIAILRARAINTFKALKSARKRLDKLEGQETLFDESEVYIDEY